MAYINFKEEIVAAETELRNRKENNNKLIKTIENDLTKIELYPDEKYSFKTFENRTINNSKTQNESEFLIISDKSIVCAYFIKCKIYNIKFKNCSFIGCSFIDCEFGGGGVIFDNCNFYQESINTVPNLNKKDNLSCSFENCTIYAQFFCSNISYVIFQKSKSKDSSFKQTDMTSAIICDSELDCIDIVDSDLSGIKIVRTYIKDLEFNDKDKSKLDPKSFIDKIQVREKTKEEYEGLYMVYQTFADKFKENNLNNNFGEYFYQCKVVQRKSLKGLSKFASFIYWATSGYGERIVFSLITSLIIIFIFAFIYLFSGIEVNSEYIQYWFGSGHSISHFIPNFNEALNLSVGMFGGIGINETIPVERTLIISDIEMVIGVIMVGIGIGTLTRKLVR